MANLFQPTLIPALDDDGNPISGAKLYFYLTGTTVPATYYLDQEGETAGPHPLLTDDNGRFLNQAYLDPETTYRVRLTDATGAEVLFDVDPVRGYDEGMVQTAAQEAIEARDIVVPLAAQVETDAAQVATDRAAAEDARDGAIVASATTGSYPNAAKDYVPRGLTQASVGAITPGSGGTNGTFALGWSSGNFSINPTGTFTVSGGALTAVTITGPGLYIGASPTVPTPSFAASSGLTGAAVALTAQFLVASGQGYWVQSAGDEELDHYVNNSGTALAQPTVGPLPTVAAVDSALALLDGRPNGTAKRYEDLVAAAGGTISSDVSAAMRRVEQILFESGAIEDIIGWFPWMGNEDAALRQAFIAKAGTGRLTGSIGSSTEATGITVAGIDTGINPGLCGAGRQGIGIGGYFLDDFGLSGSGMLLGRSSPVFWGLNFSAPYNLLLSTFNGFSPGLVAAYLLKLRGSTDTYPSKGFLFGYHDTSTADIIRNRYPLTSSYFRSDPIGDFPSNAGTMLIDGTKAPVTAVVITGPTTLARALAIQQAVEEGEAMIGRDVPWEGK
jgi:hypothetical protein